MTIRKHWADWALILGGAGLAISFALPALAQTATSTDSTTTPVVAPAPVPAPATTPTPTAEPSVTRAPSLGSTLAPVRPSLVPLRADSEVRADMERARNMLVNADGAYRTAKARTIEAHTNAEIKKRDVSAIEARLKAAKQLKAEADKADLERSRKTEEMRRTVFDRLEEAWSAEGDLAKAQTDWANALMKACEVELDVLAKAAAGGDPAQFGAEQRLLEARKLTAVKAELMAEREQTVAERKLRVYQAWTQLSSGK